MVRPALSERDRELLRLFTDPNAAIDPVEYADWRERPEIRRVLAALHDLQQIRAHDRAHRDFRTAIDALTATIDANKALADHTQRVQTRLAATAILRLAAAVLTSNYSLVAPRPRNEPRHEPHLEQRHAASHHPGYDPPQGKPIHAEPAAAEPQPFTPGEPADTFVPDGPGPTPTSAPGGHRSAAAASADPGPDQPRAAAAHQPPSAPRAAREPTDTPRAVAAHDPTGTLLELSTFGRHDPSGAPLGLATLGTHDPFALSAFTAPTRSRHIAAAAALFATAGTTDSS